ncbi:hypothetical protein DQ04_19241000 [Trypanosoma grayi]|uniref:hypothetical protein n=1 Tax=Trypanosoma grayi TaxID=71804 RepID=UPI0004F46A11|nr:hypothetical protein DQ04_19241000 [Trypanosoma grayi]KEG05695.1 hypothetical protein DQ04_19241000 [Trypanosoma grayi]
MRSAPGSIAATSSTTATPFVIDTLSSSTLSMARPTTMALLIVLPRNSKGTARAVGMQAAATTSATTRRSATRKDAPVCRRNSAAEAIGRQK